ncbi:MAG: hypothetical protein ACE5IJ_03190 [Thermoplasmata archaeon]
MANHGILTSEISSIVGLPSYIASEMSAHVPVLAPYVDFATIYIATFVESLSLTLQLGLNGYLVTVIFAYIGGIVSSQRRKEIEFARAGIPTTVLASPRQTLVSAPLSGLRGWYDVHPESYGSMKKVPVAMARRRADGVRKASPSKPSKPSKANTMEPKKEKSAASSKERERIARKLTERALRNYR